MKKAVSLLVAVLMLLALAGCGSHSSSYSAVGLFKSEGSSFRYMNFFSMNGRFVYRLEGTSEGAIQYSAKLESGSATVYYESNGTQSELFTIKGGEELDSSGGYIETGTFYIIIQTDGICRGGEFKFSY